MATKTSKPTGDEATAPAAPQAMQPAQPVYDPNVYYQQPIDPNRGKSKLLTLEYLFAMGSAVVAALLTVNLIGRVISIWMESTSVSALPFLDTLFVSSVSSMANIATIGVMAVIMSVLSFILFARVSRTVPERQGYTSTIGYKLITYGGFAVLLTVAAVLASKLVGVLVNSLLFIGVSGAGEIYKNLYLTEFLPYLVSLAVVLAVAFCTYKIINGRNMSRTMALILVVVTGVMLVAGSITVAIKAHNDNKTQSPLTTSNSSQNITIDEVGSFGAQVKVR